MLYIRLENSIPVEVSTEYPEACRQSPENWARDGFTDKFKANGWLNRTDIKSFAYANTLATLLTEQLGRTFLAADAGPNVSPQYDVIEAPRVGDKVSRSFNGDSYPCGEIVKITPTWQITTSTGKKFRRKGLTAGWREVGRGFWMIGGHVDERNPHV